jgi:hypothetical protein
LDLVLVFKLKLPYNLVCIQPLSVWWPGGKFPFLDPVWWLGLRAKFEQMGGSYFAKYPNPIILVVPLTVVP